MYHVSCIIYHLSLALSSARQPQDVLGHHEIPRCHDAGDAVACSSQSMDLTARPSSTEPRPSNIRVASWSTWSLVCRPPSFLRRIGQHLGAIWSLLSYCLVDIRFTHLALAIYVLLTWVFISSTSPSLVFPSSCRCPLISPLHSTLSSPSSIPLDRKEAT